MEQDIEVRFQGQIPGYFVGERFFPVIAGGSDTSTAGVGTESNDEEGQGGSQQQQQQTDEPYSLAPDFLKNVPDEHKPILEPYVKQWDAGVTRRFQELQGQLRPYQELNADPEFIGQALQLYQLLDQNPQQVYEVLRQQFEGQNAAGSGLGGAQTQSQMQEEPEWLENLPPEFTQQWQQSQQQLQQQGQILELLATHILDQNRSSQERQEDEQLDSYLSGLKDEFGDFNEEFVLLKMSQGLDGPQAVEAYKEFAQTLIDNGQGSEGGGFIPLSGGGAVPSQGKSVTELSGNEVKNLVAGLLAQQQQANQ